MNIKVRFPKETNLVYLTGKPNQMTITQIGLVLNIAGSILICFWGLPSNYFEKDGVPLIYSKDEDEREMYRRKWDLKKRLAISGITLLFGGFVLQLIDSFIIHTA